MSKFFKVFIAGDYPQGSFTERHVLEMAESYDRSYHEAPLTLNHDDKSPAYAAIESVVADGKNLYVSFTDILEEAYEVNKKHKKPSIEIAEYNGKAYLRAVTLTNFPQVKGLDKITFSQNGSHKEGCSLPVDRFKSDRAILFKENSVLVFNEILTLDLTKGVNMFNEKVIKLAEKLSINVSDYSVEGDIIAKAAEVVDTLNTELATLKDQVNSLNISLGKFTEAGVTIEKFAELNKEIAELKKQQVDTLVQFAQSQKDFLPAGTDSLRKLAEANFEEAKKFVDALKPKPTEPVIKKADSSSFSGVDKENVTYEQILENPTLAANFSDEEIATKKKKSEIFN